jgi:hypothetical protein
MRIIGRIWNLAEDVTFEGAAAWKEKVKGSAFQYSASIL